jgi:hypothetical protein
MGCTFSEISLPMAVKNELNWLAISIGSELGTPLTFILSMVSGFLLFPRISFKVSHVFLGLPAFSSSFEVK